MLPKNITTPQKKPRKGELTAKQKEENKKGSLWIPGI
jgi:hypothetical protein